MSDGTAEAPTEGSALRKQLEEALAVNGQLKTQLATQAVAGLKHVKPEDLKEISPTEFATKAAELEQQRAQEQDALVRAALAERGMSEEQIEATLSAKPGEQPAQQEQPQSQVASLGRLQAAPPKQGSTEGLFGVDRLRAVYRDSN